MDNATATKAKNKGTKKTEAIIGTGLNKIEQLIKSATLATSAFGELPKMLEDYSLKIADAELKISQLDTTFSEKKRQQEVDLQLAFKENGANLVAEWLQTNGRTSIQSDELNKLKDELFKATSDNKSEVNAAVASATSSLKSKYESDTKVQEANFKATEATSKATIDSLNAQVKVLNEQLVDWKKALNDERQASVERSKGQSAVVNVSGSGK